MPAFSPVALYKRLFEAQGFLKLANVFKKDFVDSLASALLDQLNLGEGTRIHNKRYLVSVPLKGAFGQPELYANPILLPLMRAILGPDCILSSVGAVVSLPGASDQHIHSDYEPLFKERPELILPPYAITLAIPLVDIDLLNGPTKIWAGSHRTCGKPFSRHLLHGPMGSCYFWDYRTLHAGGSNHSDQMRPLLYMAYTRRWFKDFLNPDRLIVDEKTIPDEYRNLFPLQRHQTAEAEADFKARFDALVGALIK